MRELGLPGGVARGVDQRFVNHNLVTRTLDKQWSLTASGDFDVFTSHMLSVIAGYRNWENIEIREGDFLPRAIVGTGELHDNGAVRTEQLSLEVRIASDQSKPFFYQVGGFAWGSRTTSRISPAATSPATARPCRSIRSPVAVRAT